MLEKIITLLNTKLTSLGVFSKLYGLAELVENESQTMPAFYCAKDEYKHIEYDEERSIAYFRVSSIDIERDDDNAATLESVHEIITYKLKCVGVVPKDVYGKDDQYSDEKIAMNVKQALTFYNDTPTADGIDADYVESNVSSIIIDRNQIITEEYSNAKVVINYDKVHFSIDFEVKLAGENDCLFTEEC